MASLRREVFLLLFLAPALTDAATKLCEDGWELGGAFCYYFSDAKDSVSVSEAHHVCQMQDAQFAWPQTESEFNFLSKMVKGRSAYGWQINVMADLERGISSYFDVNNFKIQNHKFDFLPTPVDNFDPDERCVAFNLHMGTRGYWKNQHWYETVGCLVVLRSACVGKRSDMKDQVIDNNKWFQNGKNVYWVKPLLTTYKEAKSLCESRGMALLDDPTGLYDALGSKTFDSTPFWSSVQLRDDAPYWRNGSAAKPPAFRWRPPGFQYITNYDYVLLSSGKIKSRELQGAGSLPYICKRRAVDPRRFGCPGLWTRGGRSCYLLSFKKLPWHEARSTCESQGAHLLTLDSVTEASWLKSSVLGSTLRSWWTSANDLGSEGNFVWHDGKKINASIFPWSIGKAMGLTAQCAVLTVQESKFVPVSCSDASMSACQYTLKKGERCSGGWHLYKNTCYWFDVSSFTAYVPKKLNEKICLSNVTGVEWHRVRPLEVRSDDVMSFIKSTVRNRQFWLGLVSSLGSNEFRWLDGTLYTGDYMDDYREPNNGGKNSDQPENCAVFSSRGYAYDRSCDFSYQFICEKELPGTLGTGQNGATACTMSTLYFALLLAGWLSYLL